MFAGALWYFMKKEFPSLTQSQFRRGCSVALEQYRMEQPLADAVPRKLIVIELARVTNQEKEATEEEREDDVEIPKALSPTLKYVKHSCKQCGKQFVNLKCLANHEEKRHGEILPEFKCSDCDNSYTSKRALKVHWTNKHNKDQQWMCDNCGDIQTSSYKLQLHKKKEHTILECEKSECNFTGRFEEMRKHIKNYHTYVSGGSKVTKKFTYCAKVYTSKSGYWHHMSVHKKLEGHSKSTRASTSSQNLDQITSPNAALQPDNPPPTQPVQLKKKIQLKLKFPSPYEQIRAQNIETKKKMLESLMSKNPESTQTTIPIGDSSQSKSSPVVQYLSPTTDVINVTGLGRLAKR
jgi:hypothetical protein